MGQTNTTAPDWLLLFNLATPTPTMPLLPSGCGLGTNNNMSCYNCGSAPMGQSPGCTHHELWQLQQHHSISKRGIKQGPLGHHPFHINKSMLFDSHTEPTTQTH